MEKSNHISDNIRYVGVDDLTIGLFENQYPVPQGISYNSYIIKDEKTALLDTVDAAFGQEWMARVRAELGDCTPDYLVIHHMEPDHSANIARALAEFPEMTLVASDKAVGMLSQFFEGYDFNGRTIAVKEGDELNLGSHCLTFVAAPMVHWPEVILSYEAKEKVLFSADAFGKFGVPGYEDGWTNEARRYYVNIVGKYGAQTQALLKKVSLKDIEVIAPLHGPVLSGDLSRYISLYDIWSSYRPEQNGVLVAYASVYGGTRECALEFADMLREEGIDNVVTFDLCRQDVSEAVSQAFRLSAMVLAGVTYDASLFPPMATFLHHLKMKNYRNRAVGIIENGSWAPVAGKLMAEAVAALPGIEIINPKVTLKSRMRLSDRPVMEALAKALAVKVKA
ncbi:MBL fold metallo-hydrolase [Muribaculaceae bacterium Isolate-104 (HZI)]|nr:MBL fold metallo-hydrolase [Muribaculaceae bacterium Isolate-104 (HZI)]